MSRATRLILYRVSKERLICRDYIETRSISATFFIYIFYICVDPVCVGQQQQANFLTFVRKVRKVRKRLLINEARFGSEVRIFGKQNDILARETLLSSFRVNFLRT